MLRRIVHQVLWVCLSLHGALAATPTLLKEQSYWIKSGNPVKLSGFDISDQVRLVKLEKAGYDFEPCSSQLYRILTFTAQEITFNHLLAECVASNCEEVEWESWQLASINCSGSLLPPTALKIEATFQIQPSMHYFEAQHAVGAKTMKFTLNNKCSDPVKPFTYIELAFFSDETVEYCFANISSVKALTGSHLQTCARSANCLTVILSDLFGWPCLYSQGLRYRSSTIFSNSIDQLFIFYACNSNVTLPNTTPSIGNKISPLDLPRDVSMVFIALFSVFLITTIILAVILIVSRCRLVQSVPISSVNIEQPSRNNNVVKKRNKGGRKDQQFYSASPYATKSLISSDAGSASPSHPMNGGNTVRASVNTTYCDAEINPAFPEKMKEKKCNELQVDDYEVVNLRKSGTPSELYIDVL